MELNDGFVLVDFYSEMCGPCRLMNPIVNKLTDVFKDTVEIRKVAMEDGKEVFREHNVTSVPTFVLFKDGREIARVTGGMPRVKLEEFIRTHTS